MPSPAWEDLDAFLDVAEFAASICIRLQAGGTRQVSGIFDDPYLNADLGEYDMDTSRPRVTCKEADVVDVTRGDIVVIDGREYDVMTGPQSDGTGMALLDLAPRD